MQLPLFIAAASFVHSLKTEEADPFSAGERAYCILVLLVEVVYGNCAVEFVLGAFRLK